MKRALYVSNVISHIMCFHIPYIEMLKRNGYEVDIIANACGALKPDLCDNLYDINIARNPFHVCNLTAIKQARKIIDEKQYDLIHVHTPMGGVVGRIAAKNAHKKGTKVIYTSHGFHFYKGAPLINWLLYYTMERALVHETDYIITINYEDYQRAKKFAGDKCKVCYMDGVGVNQNKFVVVDDCTREQLKDELGYKGKKILLYAAEFIPRKNHRFLIKNFAKVVEKIPDIILLLAGIGPLQQDMIELSGKLGISNNVVFLNYRRDIPYLLGACDAVVSTSVQEGFPINVAEGIETHTPAIVSSIRGNVDIILDGINGYIYKHGDGNDFVEKTVSFLSNNELRSKMSNNCSEMANRINIEILVKQMSEIYADIIK